MLTSVTMNKIDCGSYGEAWEIVIDGELETNDKGFKIPISEHQAEQIKHLFTTKKTSGKFNEHEHYS